MPDICVPEESQVRVAFRKGNSDWNQMGLVHFPPGSTDRLNPAAGTVERTYDIPAKPRAAWEDPGRFPFRFGAESQSSAGADWRESTGFRVLREYVSTDVSGTAWKVYLVGFEDGGGNGAADHDDSFMEIRYPYPDSKAKDPCGIMANPRPPNPPSGRWDYCLASEKAVEGSVLAIGDFVIVIRGDDGDIVTIRIGTLTAIVPEGNLPQAKRRNGEIGDKVRVIYCASNQPTAIKIEVLD